jgi:hypothetical protein
MEPDSRLTTPRTFTRRDLLRKSAVVGIGAGALLAASAVTATPALAGSQTHWHACYNCATMVYGRQNGQCADRRYYTHDGSASWDYWFIYDRPDILACQSDWKYCRKCNSMFWADKYRMNGICASGNGVEQHDSYGSYNYQVYYGSDSQDQSGWAYCRLCHGLFFAPWKAYSACPSTLGGRRGPHDDTGSYDYQVLVHDWT